MHTTRLTRVAIACGVVGLVLWIVGLCVEPRQALFSYLFAYAVILTIVLGALVQIMISHLTSARWFNAFRGFALALVATLPVVALFAIPVFVGVHELYVWTSPAALPPELRAPVSHKAAWLNTPFFIIRGVMYLAVWVTLGELFRRRSAPERRLSAIGAILFGLTLTFAAFDWLMSLEPAWYSTIYGVYVFAGGILAALAAIAVVAGVACRWNDTVRTIITPEQLGALGTLMFTFVIFWAYIAFAQYLIIWIGDIPADSRWYVVRSNGGWGILALVVVAGQFALPFILLLSRAIKRNPNTLALVGLLILVAHVLDIFWLVQPALHPASVHVSWLDVAALLMVGGCVVARASSVRLTDARTDMPQYRAPSSRRSQGSASPSPASLTGER